MLLWKSQPFRCLRGKFSHTDKNACEKVAALVDFYSFFLQFFSPVYSLRPAPFLPLARFAAWESASSFRFPVAGFRSRIGLRPRGAAAASLAAASPPFAGFAFLFFSGVSCLSQPVLRVALPPAPPAKGHKFPLETLPLRGFTYCILID